MTDNWAVIPVKGLTESKTRLSTSLQGDRRRILVEALLEDVLSSIIRSRVYGIVLVISPDENVGSRILPQEVSFLKQTGVGLNRAIEQVKSVDAYSISNSRVSFDIDTMSDLVELRRLDPESKTASARVTSMMKMVVSPARVR